MELFCHVTYLHTPQHTADKLGLQGHLPEDSMAIVSWPCTVLLLQPPFLQPPLFHWAIVAKMPSGQFSAATFCIRLCIKTVVEMKKHLKRKILRSHFLKVYKAPTLKKLSLDVAPEISF